MDATIQQLAKELKNGLIELYGKRFAKLILFGSYARGDFQEESDVDFLLVLNDEKVQNGKEILNIGKLVGRLLLQYNKLLTTMPVSINRFQNANTIFFNNIRREGIEI
jgi:uncharacterized protein